MESSAQNFKGAAELLGAKGMVESEEDLDNVDAVIGGGFRNCTHLAGLGKDTWLFNWRHECS